MAGRSWRAREDEYLERAHRELESAYKSAMAGWIQEAGPWDYFVTLTFDPWEIARGRFRDARGRETSLPPAVSSWCAQRRFTSFLKRAPTVLERPVEGVVAMEFHKSGQPHGHGLLRAAGGALKGDIAALSEDWRGLGGNGWIRLERPKSARDVAGYCAKYMTKDLGHLVLSAGAIAPAGGSVVTG